MSLLSAGRSAGFVAARRRSVRSCSRVRAFCIQVHSILDSNNKNRDDDLGCSRARTIRALSTASWAATAMTQLPCLRSKAVHGIPLLPSKRAMNGLAAWACMQPPQLIYARGIFSGGQKDAYDILGVSRVATDKEIRMAYLKLAKMYHPDLNPDDEHAKAKFQELSTAYANIRTDKDRNRYDASSFAGDEDPSSSSSSVHGHDMEWAEKLFQDVWVNFGFEAYVQELRGDLGNASRALAMRDYNIVKDVATKHMPLFVSVLVPVALILRFPAAVFAAARFIPMILITAFNFLPPRTQRAVMRALFETMIGRVRNAGSSAGQKAGEYAHREQRRRTRRTYNRNSGQRRRRRRR